MRRRDFISSAALATAGTLIAGSMNAVSPSQSSLHTSERDQPLSPEELVDLEQKASSAISPGGFAYIARGAGKEQTLRANARSFDRWVIQPQYLSGLREPDVTTSLLGHRLRLPVITTPMGAQGVAHKSAEIGTAQGTHAAGTLMEVSTGANTLLEDIAAASDGPKWFQIYLIEDDQQASAALLRWAQRAGYTAVVFTIDAFAPGTSDAVLRTGFSFPSHLKMPNSGTATFKRSLSWDDVSFIQDTVDLPLILKGVLSPEMALRAIEAGAAAIQVSNHGGRHLDGAPAALDVLPAIVEAVQGKIPVIMDSGIRRGTDVFKALALGADAVALGRPVLYGLALGGAQGVAGVYERIENELKRTMLIAGAKDVSALHRNYLALQPTGDILPGPA